LTPVAGYEGRIVATNLLEGPHMTADYGAIPSMVFTLPPLARVGVTEHEARSSGLDFTVQSEDTSTWYSSRRVGEAFSAFKVLIESKSRLAALIDEQRGVSVLESPAGRGRQMNVGALAARGRWFVFLHADTRLSPRWLDELQCTDG
jgi:hypothetical protein